MLDKETPLHYITSKAVLWLLLLWWRKAVLFQSILISYLMHAIAVVSFLFRTDINRETFCKELASVGIGQSVRRKFSKENKRVVMGITYILCFWWVSWGDKIRMHCLKRIWTHSRCYQLQQQKSNSINKVSQPMSSHHNDSQSLKVLFFLIFKAKHCTN